MGCDLVLHLHCLNDANQGAFLDCLSSLGDHLEDSALNWRSEGVSTATAAATGALASSRLLGCRSCCRAAATAEGWAYDLYVKPAAGNFHHVVLSDLRCFLFALSVSCDFRWSRSSALEPILVFEDKDWLKSTAPAPAEVATDAEGEEEAPKVTQDYMVEVSGRRFDVKVVGPAFGGGGGPAAAPAAKKATRSKRASGGGGGGGDTLASPIQGTVFKVIAEAGQTVEEGALICIIEAMKMENEITAHKAGVVKELAIEVGGAVNSGDTIAVITSAEA